MYLAAQIRIAILGIRQQTVQHNAIQTQNVNLRQTNTWIHYTLFLH